MSRDPRINHGEEDLRRPGKPVPSRRTREEEGEERREDRREERRSDGGSRDSRDAAVVRAGSRPRRPVERQRPAREEAVRVEVVSQRDDTPERRADCDADARDSQLGVLYAEALETVGHSTANGLGARGARRLFHKTPRPERSAEKNLGVSLSLSLSRRERERERERERKRETPLSDRLVRAFSCCVVFFQESRVARSSDAAAVAAREYRCRDDEAGGDEDVPAAVAAALRDEDCAGHDAACAVREDSRPLARGAGARTPLRDSAACEDTASQQASELGVSPRSQIIIEAEDDESLDETARARRAERCETDAAYEAAARADDALRKETARRASVSLLRHSGRELFFSPRGGSSRAPL